MQDGAGWSNLPSQCSRQTCEPIRESRSESPSPGLDIFPNRSQPKLRQLTIPACSKNWRNLIEIFVKSTKHARWKRLASNMPANGKRASSSFQSRNKRKDQRTGLDSFQDEALTAGNTHTTTNYLFSLQFLKKSFQKKTTPIRTN